MGLREDYARRIEKKKAEVDEIRTKLRLEERYLEAMYDTYKLLPRTGEESNGSAGSSFRKGSKTERAYLALKRAGHPMHIKDLAAAMGLKAERGTTQGLSSALRAYAAKSYVFTKPEGLGNTYGLIEFGEGVPTPGQPDAKESH